MDDGITFEARMGDGSQANSGMMGIIGRPMAGPDRLWVIDIEQPRH